MSADTTQEKPFLLSARWWRNAAASAARFAPRCIVPAATISGANVVMLLAIYQMLAIMQAPEPTIYDLRNAALTGVAGAVAGLALALWGVGMWLLRLTAFARCCLEGEDGQVDADLIERAVRETASRRGYLTRYWLVASVYLSVPIVPLVGLLVIQVLTSPSFSSLPVTLWVLPLWAEVAIGAAVALLFTAAIAYSLVALVVSARGSGAAGEAATSALSLTAQRWRAVSGATVAVVALNLVASLPQIVFGGKAPVPGAGMQGLVPQLAVQAWMLLVTMYLWPLSIIPFCTLLKDDLE